ncbi:MAG: amidase [Pseudomonadota bacterium]
MSVYVRAVCLVAAVSLSACASRPDSGAGIAIPATQTALDRICARDGSPVGSACMESQLSAPRNAVIEVNPEALSIAQALDQESSRGPLHGVPVLLKANIETGDAMTTTAGAHAMAGFVAQADATLVANLRAAGAVILGKTNLSEWANFRSNESVSGWSGLGGQTHNAVDPARNPCGSSSGSAVAVALGLVTMAVGTETDGSIVCPSAINGIVGIKPTLGLVSRTGIIPLAHSQDTAGPMAANVKDAALMLSVMAGSDPSDPATAEMPIGILPLRYTLDANSLQGKRIGVLRSFYGSGKYPAVESVFARTLELLSAAGATLVDPVSIDTADMGDAEYTVLLYEFKHDLNTYLAARDAPVSSLADVIAFNSANAELTMPHFGQDILTAAEAMGDLEETEYLTALDTSRRIAREGIDTALQAYDVDALIVPTNGPAWLTDYENGDAFQVGSSSLAAVSGYPSITIPAGQDGVLPLGVSLIGGRWQDASLIEIAFALEQALVSNVE